MGSCGNKARLCPGTSCRAMREAENRKAALQGRLCIMVKSCPFWFPKSTGCGKGRVGTLDRGQAKLFPYPAVGPLEALDDL